jgi:hypothetical protein
MCLGHSFKDMLKGLIFRKTSGQNEGVKGRILFVGTSTDHHRFSSVSTQGVRITDFSNHY